MDELRDDVKRIKKEIAETRKKLESEDVSANVGQRLGTTLKASLDELEDTRKREESVEASITRNQVLSRGFGFILYIVFGGVVGALLGDRIQIEGITGDPPKYFQAIAIGATWTTFLSVVGVKTGLGQSRRDN